MNYLKTGLIMVLMAAIFLAVGALLGGKSGLVMALFISLAFNFGMYWFGANLALSFARARPLEPHEAPWLVQANEEICRKAGIPTVPLYLSPDPQPNAFACGRGPGAASICVNAGLLNNMSQREVIGVLAHEIAHVKNRDTLTMTIVAAMASAIMFLSRFALFFGSNDRQGGNALAEILLFILGPIAAMLIQLWVSRVREFEADKTAALFLGDPHPLADALETLERGTQAIPAHTGDPAVAHMYIANPFSGRGLAALFSTHPPIEERVRRLRSMAV